MIGHETPAEADSTGATFTFQYGAAKLDGKQGFADVFKRGCFGWEYKGKHANLDKAYQQLLQYRASLHNPPLLVVSDFATIVVRPSTQPHRLFATISGGRQFGVNERPQFSDYLRST